MALWLATGAARAQQLPFPEEFSFDARSNILLGSGARAFGMGGAFLARADDATAASWNPAGLSYLRRPEFSVVGNHNSFSFVTRTPAGVATDDDRFRGTTPDFASLAYPVNVGTAPGAVQLSFHRVLSFSTTRDIVRVRAVDPAPRVIRLESDGGFDVLALGSGLSFSRRWRAGATVNRWLNGYRQDFERSVVRPEFVRRDFRFSGWNFNLGVMGTFGESVNVGAVFKTPFTADVRLRQERLDEGVVINSAESGERGLPDMRLEFPGAVGFGVSWRLSSPLTVSADYTRTFWSDARIRNNFELPASGPPDPETDVFPDLPYPNPRGSQVDTEQIRVGVEYVVVGARVKWPLRLGYFNDRQYFRDFTGSPPRFNGLTAGTGLILGPILLDAAYVYEGGSSLERRDDAPEGELPSRVRVRAHRVYVSFIFRLGAS